MERDRPVTDLFTSNPLDVGAIFFTNLQLLGFDCKKHEKKYMIIFNKDMFSLPNKKGFEVVLHFLFSRLDPNKSKELFRDCWPVNDKKQEQIFRRVCLNWNNTIAKDEPNGFLPKISPSLYMSPGGRKFLHYIHIFSRYVFMKCRDRELGVKSKPLLQYPLLTGQNLPFFSAMESVYEASVGQSTQQFLQHVPEATALQRLWQDNANNMVKRYRVISKEVRQLEQELATEVRKLAEHHSKDPSWRGSDHLTDVQAFDANLRNIKRTNHVQKVRGMWKSLENFNEQEAKNREIVDSILNRVNNYIIDGEKLNVQLPDLLLRECEAELHRRGIDNIYKEGKLNLLSLIHLWNLSLHLYIEHLHSDGVADFSKAIPVLSTQTHLHKAHVANAKMLRSELRKEMIPELKENISNLRSKLDSLVLESKSPGSVRSTTLGVGFVPPTPPVEFHLGNISDKGDTPQIPLLPARSNYQHSESTPEAATQLMSSIQHSDDCQKKAHTESILAQGDPVYNLRLSSQGSIMSTNIPKLRDRKSNMNPRNLSSVYQDIPKEVHETVVPGSEGLVMKKHSGQIMSSDLDNKNRPSSSNNDKRLTEQATKNHSDSVNYTEMLLKHNPKPVGRVTNGRAQEVKEVSHISSFQAYESSNIKYKASPSTVTPQRNSPSSHSVMKKTGYPNNGDIHENQMADNRIQDQQLLQNIPTAKDILADDIVADIFKGHESDDSSSVDMRTLLRSSVDKLDSDMADTLYKSYKQVKDNSPLSTSRNILSKETYEDDMADLLSEQPISDNILTKPELEDQVNKSQFIKAKDDRNELLNIQNVTKYNKNESQNDVLTVVEQEELSAHQQDYDDICSGDEGNESSLMIEVVHGTYSERTIPGTPLTEKLQASGIHTAQSAIDHETPRKQMSFLANLTDAPEHSVSDGESLEPDSDRSKTSHETICSSSLETKSTESQALEKEGNIDDLIARYHKIRARALTKPNQRASTQAPVETPTRPSYSSQSGQSSLEMEMNDAHSSNRLFSASEAFSPSSKQYSKYRDTKSQDSTLPECNGKQSEQLFKSSLDDSDSTATSLWSSDNTMTSLHDASSDNLIVIDLENADVNKFLSSTVSTVLEATEKEQSRTATGRVLASRSESSSSPCSDMFQWATVGDVSPRMIQAQETPKADEKTAPVRGLGSVPLSPLTDSLHPDDSNVKTSSSAARRIINWTNLLDEEDDSILLPPSPLGSLGTSPLQLDSTDDVPVERLLDI